MINRLIKMEVPSNISATTPIIDNKMYTISDYARVFIEGMGKTQQERFKKMLENGIKCGMSVADNYGIDYDDFIEEVKKQMGVI